jgi:BirA family biotin operon repressor/biotin-[acetyl-CoA-carboxylase] ligase
VRGGGESKAGSPPPARAELEAETLGRPRLHLRRTSSTNDRARALALAGAPHGTLVTAAEQTAGRGRQGRTWSAPPGSSLLMSLVLRRPISDRSPAPLPLVAAAAVCDVAGEDARVKWPNDVVIGAPMRKLAGILVEGRPQEGWAVVGIGINVAVRVEDLPADVRATAASLRLSPSAIEPLLAQLLETLERRLTEPAEAVLSALRARDALAGRDVAWSESAGPQAASPDGEPGGHAQARRIERRGRAAGIDEQGRLVVEADDGLRVRLSAGEVHLSAG